MLYHTPTMLLERLSALRYLLTQSTLQHRQDIALLLSLNDSVEVDKTKIKSIKETMQLVLEGFSIGKKIIWPRRH